MGKQDEFIKTALRVPPDLHKQLHEAAAANNRTFNAEIVSRLQNSFPQPSENPVIKVPDTLILEHLARLKELLSARDKSSE